MPLSPRPSRRALLAAAGAALAVAAGGYAVPRLRRHLAPAFDFEPVAGAPGFRRLAGGAVSAGSAFVGIDAGDGDDSASASAVRAAPCQALFDDPDPTGRVPIAYFSDYRCPVCRELEPVLADLAADAEDVRIARHQLPILSRHSEMAARAALAARAQGAYTAMARRLMGTSFRPTDGYLRAVAGELGLDPDKLVADMARPAVTRALATSRALADMLGLIGTPSLVVGRTVVVGAIDRGRLERLAARERRDGPIAACAGLG